MPGDRSELIATADALREAAAAAEEAEPADRCARLADRFDALADRSPDHGTLARLDATLRELEEATTGAATDHVATAREEVRSYRTGVDGV